MSVWTKSPNRSCFNASSLHKPLTRSIFSSQNWNQNIGTNIRFGNFPPVLRVMIPHRYILPFGTSTTTSQHSHHVSRCQGMRRSRCHPRPSPYSPISWARPSCNEVSGPEFWGCCFHWVQLYACEHAHTQVKILLVISYRGQPSCFLICSV